MASVGNPHQNNKDQELHSLDEASPFAQAWKSVKKHFPNSRVHNNPCTVTNSIVLFPMPNIDLSFEFCFKMGSNIECPDVDVRSEKISETFISELKKILVMKCNNMTEWLSLGNEIEKILQCVEVTRKEKGVRKKKSNNKKSASKFSEQKRSEDEFISQDELHFEINPFTGIHEKKAPRPNYFIAVRIHDKNIVQNISMLQSFLVSQESLLTKGVIPSEALHLTLCNLGLDSADDLLCAIETMNQIKPQLEQILPKSPFIVHSVSQFYNRAIYAKVKLHDDFLTFRDLLRKNLEEAGVEFREDHEGFTPHVTVIKVRRPERRAFGTRNIQPSIYESYVDVVHGEQTVNGLYLCAMGGQKREDGFYVTAAELHFNSVGD